jgi:hypothetical protein
MLSDGLPAFGVVPGVVKAKVPRTVVLLNDADPPVNVDEASVWP